MSSLMLRILAVEDYKLAQKVLVMTMEPLGCIVDVAETGAAAITQFKKQHYDLVLMDLGLPDMTGCAVTEILRALEQKAQRKQHIPIVALTAHSESDVRQSALDSGMDDFICKPLTRDGAKTMLGKYTVAAV